MKHCGVQESWEERAQQVSTTLCSMCSANSLDEWLSGAQPDANLRFQMCQDPETGEIEYIEWTGGLTKTRQEGLVKQDRRVPQNLFTSNTECCPVKLSY